MCLTPRFIISTFDGLNKMFIQLTFASFNRSAALIKIKLAIFFHFGPSELFSLLELKMSILFLILSIIFLLTVGMNAQSTKVEEVEKLLNDNNEAEELGNETKNGTKKGEIGDQIIQGQPPHPSSNFHDAQQFEILLLFVVVLANILFGSLLLLCYFLYRRRHHRQQQNRGAQLLLANGNGVEDKSTMGESPFSIRMQTLEARVTKKLEEEEQKNGQMKAENAGEGKKGNE